MSCGCVLQRGHSGDGREVVSTLCSYVLRNENLFVLNWARCDAWKSLIRAAEVRC